MIVNITGIDGCGKTTQVELLTNKLQVAGKKVFLSKAYGYAEKATYQQLLPAMDQVSIMFLFQALHTQQRVKALSAEKEGFMVISDRWDDSYLAYHRSFGVLSGREGLRDEMNQLAFNGRKADLTFLLDLSPEEAAQRMERRGRSFFDRNSIKHFAKLRSSFLHLAKEKEWSVVNGCTEVSSLANIIYSQVKKIL